MGGREGRGSYRFERISLLLLCNQYDKNVLSVFGFDIAKCVDQCIYVNLSAMMFMQQNINATKNSSKSLNSYSTSISEKDGHCGEMFAAVKMWDTVDVREVFI